MQSKTAPWYMPISDYAASVSAAPLSAVAIYPADFPSVFQTSLLAVSLISTYIQQKYTLSSAIFLHKNVFFYKIKKLRGNKRKRAHQSVTDALSSDYAVQWTLPPYRIL